MYDHKESGLEITNISVAKSVNGDKNGRQVSLF